MAKSKVITSRNDWNGILMNDFHICCVNGWKASDFIHRKLYWSTINNHMTRCLSQLQCTARQDIGSVWCKVKSASLKFDLGNPICCRKVAVDFLATVTEKAYLMGFTYDPKHGWAVKEQCDTYSVEDFLALAKPIYGKWKGQNTTAWMLVAIATAQAIPFALSLQLTPFAFFKI